MMKLRRFTLLAALGLLVASAEVSAEDPKVTEQEEQETKSFGLRALKDRFEAAAPAVGERVPNLPAYTASGERVQIHDLLLGHHSVLVFGCLT